MNDANRIQLSEPDPTVLGETSEEREARLRTEISNLQTELNQERAAAVHAAAAKANPLKDKFVLLNGDPANMVMPDQPCVEEEIKFMHDRYMRWKRWRPLAKGEPLPAGKAAVLARDIPKRYEPIDYSQQRKSLPFTTADGRMIQKVENPDGTVEWIAVAPVPQQVVQAAR